jgi:hypothetical protein
LDFFDRFTVEARRFFEDFITREGRVTPFRPNVPYTDLS